MTEQCLTPDTTSPKGYINQSKRYGDYAEALIRKYGIEEFNALIERSKKTKSWTEKELLTLIIAIRNPNNYTKIYNKLLNQL